MLESLKKQEQGLPWFNFVATFDKLANFYAPIYFKLQTSHNAAL